MRRPSASENRAHRSLTIYRRPTRHGVSPHFSFSTGHTDGSWIFKRSRVIRNRFPNVCFSDAGTRNSHTYILTHCLSRYRGVTLSVTFCVGNNAECKRMFVGLRRGARVQPALAKCQQKKMYAYTKFEYLTFTYVYVQKKKKKKKRIKQTFTSFSKLILSMDILKFFQYLHTYWICTIQF